MERRSSERGVNLTTTIAVGVVRLSRRKKKKKFHRETVGGEEGEGIVVTESFVSREPQLVSFFPRRLGLLLFSRLFSLPFFSLSLSLFSHSHSRETLTLKVKKVRSRKREGDVTRKIEGSSRCA